MFSRFSASASGRSGGHTGPPLQTAIPPASVGIDFQVGSIDGIGDAAPSSLPVGFLFHEMVVWGQRTGGEVLRRNSRIILAAVFGLLIHLCGDALAGPAREGASVRRNQAATPGGAVKPGGPTASSPFVVVIDPGHGGGGFGGVAARSCWKRISHFARRGCWPRSSPDGPR